MSVVDKVKSIAGNEVGYHEGFSNGHWNNKEKYAAQVPGLEWADYQAWCGTFASWVFMKAGLKKGAYPVTASCAAGVAWYRKAKRWSEYPAIGAQVFFGAGGGTHTGIVIDYNADTITTIEGNTNNNGSAEGDGVYKKTRNRRDAYTYGYGYPLYPEGIKSADPKWAEKPKPVEPKPKPAPVRPKPAPSKPKPKAKPVAPKFPGRNLFKVGQSNKWVTHLDKVLIKAGFSKRNDGNGYQPGPLYTEWTKANVKDFQKSKGWTGSDADGLVGPQTWAELHKKAGYRVV